MLFIFNELRTATAAATSDKLGEILLREGLITQDQLKKALLEQKNTGMRLGYTLVKLGFVEETEISKMLARQYRMPAVDLSRFEVDPLAGEERPREPGGAPCRGGEPAGRRRVHGHKPHVARRCGRGGRERQAHGRAREREEGEQEGGPAIIHGAC